jgi:hypothetical protein
LWRTLAGRQSMGRHVPTQLPKFVISRSGHLVTRPAAVPQPMPEREKSDVQRESGSRIALIWA